MPHFLIIGAGKAGTTALYKYLDQHPHIYMSPVKETNFFALEGERAVFRGPGVQERINRWSLTRIEEYRALFDRAPEGAVMGEACPLYLYSAKAAGRIRHHIPRAKLIAILRNPVDRAYSAFMHLIRDDREPFSGFSQALDQEEARIRDNWPWIWHYKRAGFYHAQLQRYFDLFDRQQIRIYLYEDLQTKPDQMLLDIFRFLNVNSEFNINVSLRDNVSGIPRSRSLHFFLIAPNSVKALVRPLIPKKLGRRVVKALENRNLRPPPKMSSTLRRQLAAIYREDILRLQVLIQRDLREWLE